MIDYKLIKQWGGYLVMTECHYKTNLQMSMPVNDNLIAKIIKSLAKERYQIGETVIEVHNDRLNFITRYGKYPTEEQIQQKHDADVKAFADKLNELLPIFSIISAYHAVRGDMG